MRVSRSYQETEMTSRVTFIGSVYLPRRITAICVVFCERLAEIMPFDLRMSDDRSRNRRLFVLNEAGPDVVVPFSISNVERSSLRLERNVIYFIWISFILDNWTADV